MTSRIDTTHPSLSWNHLSDILLAEYVDILLGVLIAGGVAKQNLDALLLSVLHHTNHVADDDLLRKFWLPKIQPGVEFERKLESYTESEQYTKNARLMYCSRYYQGEVFLRRSSTGTNLHCTRNLLARRLDLLR